MLQDLGWLKRVKILDSGGTVINPSTNEKLDELKAVLVLIEDAVDDLEIKADTINLNTDTLEAKLQLIKDQLNVLLSTRASEDTLQSVLNALGASSGIDILSQLQSLNNSFDVNISTLAKESTQIDIRDYLDTVETKLQSIITILGNNLDTNLHDKDGTGISSKDEGSGIRSLDVNIRSGDVNVVIEPPAETARIREYVRQDVTIHPTVLITYTVPSGKILDINAWHLQTEGAKTLVKLTVDGVEEDAIRFDNTGNTNRTQASFGNGAIRAQAGQIVKIETISGHKNKEYITGILGILGDA